LAAPLPGTPGRGQPNIQAPFAGMLGRFGMVNSPFGGGDMMQQFLRRRMLPQIPGQMQQPLPNLPTPNQSGLPRGLHLLPPMERYPSGGQMMPRGGQMAGGLPGMGHGGTYNDLTTIGSSPEEWASGKNKRLFPSMERLGEVAGTQRALMGGTYGPGMLGGTGEGIGQGSQSGDLLRRLLAQMTGGTY